MAFSYLDELEELEDITDTLAFEDEPSIFTEEYAVELVETALLLMDNYMEQHPTAISQPNFHDILLEDIKEIFYVQMEDIYIFHLRMHRVIQQLNVQNLMFHGGMILKNG